MKDFNKEINTLYRIQKSVMIKVNFLKYKKINKFKNSKIQLS
jgi:hypothetical protein